MSLQTIEGPAIPVNEPGSTKLFDIYCTTNKLTFHQIDQEAAGFYNAPIATFTPPLPERAEMRDLAIFPRQTTNRIPRSSIKLALKMDGKSEMTEKYSTPRKELFETLIPRHKYLDEWDNKHIRCLSRMYLSEYKYTIGNKTSAARNLPRLFVDNLGSLREY